MFRASRSRGFFFAVLLAAISTVHAYAQSTAATILGTVRDQQDAPVTGAVIKLKNSETGQDRGPFVADTAGRFKVLGLQPGEYVVTLELAGFVTQRQEVSLKLNDEKELLFILQLTAVQENLTVVAPLLAPSKTSLARTITTREIDRLPVPGRDFATLAQLTPGILTNHSALAPAGNPGISAAGQHSRNNRFFVDGVAFDSMQTGLPRGSFSIDGIREFVVISNSFAAEYGLASGAIVAVATRSGSNRLSGRALYLHRDDALDATPGSAKLIGVQKTGIEQKTVGGFLGGPIKQNRAFFFASLERTMNDTERVVTSNEFAVFRPGQSPVYANPIRDWQLLGRADGQHRGGQVTVRTRFFTSRQPHLTLEDPAIVAPERTHDANRRAVDLALLGTSAIGTRAFNDARIQFAVERFRLGLRRYCLGCPSENRRTLLLGNPPNMPQSIDESRLQAADTFTWILPHGPREHTLKAGFDLSASTNTNDQLADTYGTFGNFASSDPAAMPRDFSQRVGASFSRLRVNSYSVFLLDQWRPASAVTLNVGARWDYVQALGFTQKADNVAPRLGVGVRPFHSGRTMLRGSYGRYYDSAYLQFTRNDSIADRQLLYTIRNPTYVPWTPGTPYVNPRDSASTLEDRNLSRVLTKDVPYTDQVSVGIQHGLGSKTLMAIDVVRAKGRNLFVRRDQNYPLRADGATRDRPDRSLEKILAVESVGKSWYTGVIVRLEGHQTTRNVWSIAYTWSRAERTTEDHNFMPQDHRFPDADRGASLSDARHRFVATLIRELPLGLRAAGVLTARSALPYNITTGEDGNRDGFPTTDRPDGVRRNSGRGDDFWQLDARLSRFFRLAGRSRLEVLADAFNLTNHRNWTNHQGNRSSDLFGKPLSSEIPRLIQIGARVDW